MTFERILLVGQAPNQHGDPRRPLVGGRTGTKIQTLAGLDLREYARTFDLVNLLSGWEGKDGNGDAFDLARAKVATRALLRSRTNRAIILVGRAVADAFGVPGTRPYLAWFLHEGRAMAILPHTSGVNRWWNDPENEKAAEIFLRAAVKTAAEEPPGNRVWDANQATWVKRRRR